MPDTWPAWIRRFDRFRIVSCLSNRQAKDKISTLVYTMGDQAEDILNDKTRELRPAEGVTEHVFRGSSKPDH